MIFQAETPNQLTPENVTAWAVLIDKYGFSMIAAIVLTILLVTILFLFIKGLIVPRIYLDRSEEDRDRMQKIMEEERVRLLVPMMEWVNSVKKDNSDGRGG